MNHWDTVKKVRGIYKVTNKINGKVYIGQSVDIGRRWRQHMTAKDDIYFHKAIQKYGVENFEWEVIEQCKKKDLDAREIYWIEYYDSFNKGYNCTKGGEGNSGEGSPNWKGGISYDLEHKKEYGKQYYQVNKEELKEYGKQWYEVNKEKMKEYREANKEKIKQQMKEYYEVNKEELKEKQKEYDKVNKEKKKEYREANKKKIKEKKKEYYETNKDKIKEKAKEYYEENKEKAKEKVKEYYEANKDKRKEKMKEYYEANKDKMKEYHRQRNKKSMKNTLFN